MDTATATILKNRAQGHRDSTYAMLLQLVETNQLPECLHVLEQMVTTPRIGCWRDVRGFIRHFEEHGRSHTDTNVSALIQGCVRMTNAQLRKDYAAAPQQSWAAKWVPREPKCRRSLLLQWYYDALATDMFPGEPDAKRRYRKLITWLTPPQAEPVGLAWLVKQALSATTNANATTSAQSEPNNEANNAINAMWQEFKRKHMQQNPLNQMTLIPALSLAHSMGAGHNNCLHAGIGVALLLSPHGRVITFSSHAQWHTMKDPDDFVSNVQSLINTARSPTNGLNANLGDVTKLNPLCEPVVVVSDMEHDPIPIEEESTNPTPKQSIVFWNVSRNGLPADFHGDYKINAIIM